MNGIIISKQNRPWLLVPLLLIACLLGFISCTGDDEPESSIGYYLMIQTRVPIKTAGSMPPPPKYKLIGDLTRLMQKGIKEVYPKHDMQGNDGAVITACDDVYLSYTEIYRDSAMVATNTLGATFHTDCVVVLYRARMTGTIVRASYLLKTYRF